MRGACLQWWADPVVRGRRPGRPAAVTQMLDSAREERVQGPARTRGAAPPLLLPKRPIRFVQSDPAPDRVRQRGLILFGGQWLGTARRQRRVGELPLLRVRRG